MDIATLLYIGGALTGTVVGDAFDPLSLNEDGNKIIVQEMCDTTTTTDSNGLVSKIETCKTMKTTQHNQ
jgi:hypothetical protein